MRFWFLLIITVIIALVADRVNAQSPTKSSRGIVLTLFVDDPSGDNYFIPVNTNRAGARDEGGGGVAKDAGEGYTGPPLPPGYGYEWTVSVVDKSRSRVKLWIKEVDDGTVAPDGTYVGCNAYKEFFVRRNRRTVISMGCKAKVVAFYGSDPLKD